MDDNYKIVRFDIYCPKCLYEDMDESKEPCRTCLAIPARQNSERPEKYQEDHRYGNGL